MTDAEFLAQLTNCTLPKSEFNHQGHLRAAWILLAQNPFEKAEQLMIENIKRYAASIGASHIYHETMTRAWMRIMNKAMRYDVGSIPKETVYQYYSRARLESDEAKKSWIEPDLKTF